MRPLYFERVVKNFEWDLLKNMYGCADSTIIGFLATQWLEQSRNNSVLDGAPSPEIGRGRRGKRNSDLLLCEEENPVAVIEVATRVDSYQDKLETIYKYIDNDSEFEGLETGVLFMNNMCSGPGKYRHNWKPVKRITKAGPGNILLISVEKQKSRSVRKRSVLSELRRRNDYYPWDIVTIDYWMRTKNGRTREGNLWSR